MEKLATFLFNFIMIFSVCATADEANWNSSEQRSLSLSLSIEENELHIYSEKQWDNVNIQIQDINGIIYNLTSILLTAGEEIVIPLEEELPAGNYQVSLIRNGYPINWYVTKK